MAKVKEETALPVKLISKEVSQICLEDALFHNKTQCPVMVAGRELGFVKTAVDFTTGGEEKLNHVITLAND